MKLRVDRADDRTATLTVNVAAARAAGRERLGAVTETPGLDADLLLGHATGLDRTGMITRSADVLDAEALRRYEALIERRLRGEPVAYIVGSKSFRMIDLVVDARVLVPRPETELLVEVGLAALDVMPGKRRLIDVGTGSGAIALSIATEVSPDRRDEIEFVASDISQDALDVAAKNRQALGLELRVDLIRSNLLEDASGQFDIILANLPYLRDEQRHPSTEREPDRALYAGHDGLDYYRRLFADVSEHLMPDGVVVIEIDPSQALSARQLGINSLGAYSAVLRDLAGLARVVIAGPVDIVRTVTDTCSHGA